MCGFLALCSVLLLNVPVFVEGTYADGENGEFEKESTETRNLVRNSFANTDIDKTSQNTDDSEKSNLLDERTHKRNNFSYEHPDKIKRKILSCVPLEVEDELEQKLETFRKRKYELLSQM